MTPLALTLVLVAACLHTGWNIILKRAENRQFVGWWAMLVGALIFSPLIVMAWPLPVAIWPYLFASAIVEAAYMLLLSKSYEQADFSLVYPIARGTAPALLTLWSILFLGDQLSSGGIVGLALILAGLVTIGVGHWWAQRGQGAIRWSNIGLPVSVALAISIYSAIDAAAVRIANPAAYNALVFVATWLTQAPIMFIRYGTRPAVLTLQNEWRRIVPIGILMLATYMLVLTAYASSTASYVGAVREISIVLAAIVGWRWLGEGFGRLRILGACLTFCGIVAIAILA
jgi:drug/metabolite transporter (DMT)-like permease